MSEQELKEFEEFIKNMSNEQWEQLTKETEKEIFTEEFYKELNGEN